MKFLLVDDHQMFRESLGDYLARESFVDEVFHAESVASAMAVLEAQPIDLVVSDLGFPESSGHELFAWCVEHCPETRVVCLTMHSEVSMLRETVRRGVSGFVTKNSGYDELLAGVRRVADGGVYLDQVMLKKLLDALEREGGAPVAGPAVLAELTSREREVLNLLLAEHDPPTIADVLFISSKTVENHRSSIYRKLGVHDRLSLHSFARQHGLIE